MSRRRIAAVVALVLPPVTLAVAATLVVEQFPTNLIALACVAVAGFAGWYGLLRHGAARALGASIAALAVIAASVLLLARGDVLEQVLVVSGLLVSLAAARAAFARHVSLPRTPAPRRPVLFFNPKSGGGKAERFSLAAEARERGIEPVELRPGADLEALVRDAVAGGAGALAMAGGDGSQAIVAAIAAEHDLPYACIPAGTRNHFALDLGVDRDDVVGALDAFVDGGQRRVDLAEVNGRVFVNNVSLGLYGEAVQEDSYRDSKLRTLLDTAPAVLGPDGEAPDLRWRDPDGGEHRSAATILVSNNQYRAGSGSRPRIDDGLLGIAAVEVPAERRERGDSPPIREWSATEFQVDSEGPVAAGIDGEAMRLDPPLRFRILPGALQVRIAHAHPGASPSANIPEGLLESVKALALIALGRET